MILNENFTSKRMPRHSVQRRLPCPAHPGFLVVGAGNILAYPVAAFPIIAWRLPETGMTEDGNSDDRQHDLVVLH